MPQPLLQNVNPVVLSPKTANNHSSRTGGNFAAILSNYEGRSNECDIKSNAPDSSKAREFDVQDNDNRSESNTRTQSQEQPKVDSNLRVQENHSSGKSRPTNTPILDASNIDLLGAMGVVDLSESEIEETTGPEEEYDLEKTGDTADEEGQEKSDVTTTTVQVLATAPHTNKTIITGIDHLPEKSSVQTSIGLQEQAEVLGASDINMAAVKVEKKQDDSDSQVTALAVAGPGISLENIVATSEVVESSEVKNNNNIIQQPAVQGLAPQAAVAEQNNIKPVQAEDVTKPQTTSFGNNTLSPSDQEGVDPENIIKSVSIEPQTRPAPTNKKEDSGLVQKGGAQKQPTNSIQIPLSKEQTVVALTPQSQAAAPDSIVLEKENVVEDAEGKLGVTTQYSSASISSDTPEIADSSSRFAVTDQIKDIVKAAKEHPNKEITLDLHPADLGAIRVKLEFEGTTIKAINISVEKPDTHDIILSTMEVLRRAVQEIEAASGATLHLEAGNHQGGGNNYSNNFLHLQAAQENRFSEETNSLSSKSSRTIGVVNYGKNVLEHDHDGSISRANISL